MSAPQIQVADFIRAVQKHIDRSGVSLRRDLREGIATHLVAARVGKTLYLVPDAAEQYLDLIAVKRKAG